MKRAYHLLGILVFAISPFALTAQQEQGVLFSNGTFFTGSNVRQLVFKKETLAPAIFGKQYFVLLQFGHLPSVQERENLRQAGIELHSYLPGNAYLATLNADLDAARAASLDIASINIVPPAYKIDPQLAAFKPAASKAADRKIAVNFYPSVPRAMVIQELQKRGAIVVDTKFTNDHTVFIQANTGLVDSIASLPFVSAVRLQTFTDKPLNYNDVATHGISGLNAANGKNLNGRGITIGIGDNADISTHVDFTGRLIIRTPAQPIDHGTHVAGTAGGAGILNVKYHGMAPKATLLNQYFSDIILNAPTYVTDNNMAVTNNSYYSTDDGCLGDAEYDFLSNYVDAQAGQLPELLHVISSGNDGVFTCSGFPSGYATVKSGWQCGKNVLTVGAINTEDYTIADFSSRGPIKDGRLKPEITAGGWAITSTTTYNNYGVNYGTSMASPVVTGSLALMYERYRQTHAGANPKAALLKALVCNTAEDLGNKGPDFTFGFGMLNARRAVEALDSNRFFISTIANGGNKAHAITLPANTRQLKVLLYWPDSAADPNAALSLVNDLDLTVAGPAASLHRPLILNPSPVAVSALATEGADHTNNIEQVVIDNPPAGVYSLRVNGFNLPFGPAEYVVSYEIVRPSVTVEYPFGGETLVPGETENIRWSAYGNETNTLTIQYSTNNGSSWVLIDNNVPAASRKYAWTVPATNTTQALVRITRNGTALTDQSDFGFTILGSPVATVTNACEGAAQLNWSAVSGASSYDVLQLVGDSMQVIANTTANTYLAKGLDRNTLAWFGVAARFGTGVGRRSISVSVLPNGGACTLATFNNDLRVDSILEPSTARQGFSNEANALRPVRVLIRNLGQAPVAGPFNVSYRYANTVVTQAVNTTIAAGGTTTFSFSTALPVVAAGARYDLKAWTSLAVDGNHLNDTAYKTVKYINNDPITAMPVKEGFETVATADYTEAEMAIGGNKFLDFSASTPRGRARPFVNSGFAHSGTKALSLDQYPASDSTNADSLTFSYNLSNYTNNQLRLDFYYKNHGQSTAGANKLWIRGSEANRWVQAYDLFANQSALGDWKHAVINVNEVLNSAVPAQPITKTFQLRLGEEGLTSLNTAHPLVDIDDGYTFDDLTLAVALNDVALLKILSPDTRGCSLGASNPVSVRIKNYNNAVLSNIPVSYRVNGGAIVTEVIPSLAPGQTLDYIFTKTANLAAFKDYTIDTWVKYPSDNYSTNDSIVGFNLHNSPVISSYPYLQNFEADNGFFFAKGNNSSWQWGTPAKPVINKAASGNQAWVTSLTANYNNNETSYLYSPCFDISGLSRPVLSFSHTFITELNYDFSWAEYSTDGATWQKLGAAGGGTNWYNDTAQKAWGGGNTAWHVASIDLPVTSANIRFRFVLKSDGGVTEAGVGIDDIHVFEKAPVYEGNPVTGITQTLTGNNWIDFSSGGRKIASLNANGNNLGATTVQVYPYLGSVRNSNDQYYVNRNIVIRPARPATGNIGVRFYFTDTEAQALLNANGCTTCNKPIDPYELGLTQYSGRSGDENGSLADDTTGYFQFISPANTTVVPYDNGYYAEFSVKGFSEFWLSAGNIQPAASGVCAGDTIVFKVGEGADSYQWQQNSGNGYANISNNARYLGTNTSTLQLINLPTSFAGYTYRCLVNGVPREANAVRFSSTWTGRTSRDWFIAANWSCGKVPDQYTNVTIPNGISLYPVINATTTIKSISVHPGATVTVSSPAQLKLSGASN